jgi:hypothetical protein
VIHVKAFMPGLWQSGCTWPMLAGIAYRLRLSEFCQNVRTSSGTILVFTLGHRIVRQSTVTPVPFVQSGCIGSRVLHHASLAKFQALQIFKLPKAVQHAAQHKALRQCLPAQQL